MKTRLLSIIIPCYNEEKTLPIIYDALCGIIGGMEELDYEILLLNDGSKDQTLQMMRQLAKQDEHVNYYSFSRNFGKEAAVYAGLCNSRGDYVVLMDADMQDPPSLIPRMVEILEAGEYDCVATRRVNRAGEPPIRSWFAKKFYTLINKISDVNIVDGARDFRMMKRTMVDAIIAMGERNRFSKGIFGWIGFKKYWISYENTERVAGKTKWSFWSLFKYAVNGIIDFSEAPLSIASWFGMVMTVIAFLFLVFIIVRRIVFGDPVAGWASTICVIIFIGGIQLFCLGVMGQYIAKNYSESKHRPHYIVAETNKEKTDKPSPNGQCHSHGTD